MVENKLSEEDIQKINKKLLESLQNYRKFMSKMVGDMPIGVLCLDKYTERVLKSQGFDRVYDLFDLDLTKIKRLGRIRAGNLASRLEQFISVR